MFVAAALVGAIVLPATGKSYCVLGVVAAGYAVTAVAYRLAVRRRLGVPASPSPSTPSRTAGYMPCCCAPSV